MGMRQGFSIFMFLFSVVFLLLSFKFDLFTDSKPGAGLFPITTALLLVILTGFRCFKDLRDRRTQEGSKEHAADVWWLLILTSLFVLLMTYLGAVLSMVLYIYFLLSRFNPKAYVQNVVNSLLIPAILFAMFDIWLNAGLPKGFLGFM